MFLSLLFFCLSVMVLKACPPNCIDCSPATVCHTCASNFTLVQKTHLCVACPKNCISCKDLKDGSLSCSECQKPYLLNGTVCQLCPKECDKCLIDSNLGLICKGGHNFFFFFKLLFIYR